ncbi:magnesium and cobalt transport protein CorA [Nocardioides insulae]|uniref:magnesium and cobalt transport protein CorA n=1 Tax=Nocardioides insulae TaxID=394734 RepID=UPI00049199FB|nr:magnesium and cobalt transport protein CorA [Nocardioides insulae]
MIVDSGLYRGGRRIVPSTAPHRIPDLRAGVREPGDFVWLGLHDPGEDEVARVAEEFELHPLAVEDALSAHQRPKLEQYGDTLFLVLKTLRYAADDTVETGEISVFLGKDFVVTVRHGPGMPLGAARAALDGRIATGGLGPSAAVHAVVDLVVDGYLEVVADLMTDVDEVETSVFSPQRTKDSTRIYTLRRELAEVRRAVQPLLEPIQRFASGGVYVDAGVEPFFRDVLDHLTRAADTVDSLETLLSGAFDAHLAQLSLQQNEDMRRISAGAALIVVPTLIAGVYGMNFRVMPELDWAFGYPYALILMAATVVGLWIFFRRSGWF